MIHVKLGAEDPVSRGLAERPREYRWLCPRPPPLAQPPLLTHVYTRLLCSMRGLPPDPYALSHPTDSSLHVHLGDTVRWLFALFLPCQPRPMVRLFAQPTRALLPAYHRRLPKPGHRGDSLQYADHVAKPCSKCENDKWRGANLTTRHLASCAGEEAKSSNLFLVPRVPGGQKSPRCYGCFRHKQTDVAWL